MIMTMVPETNDHIAVYGLMAFRLFTLRSSFSLNLEMSDNGDVMDTNIALKSVHKIFFNSMKIQIALEGT